ncbi:MAG: VCBS repeat-containing protein, partial [Acidobacteria bacterium]|nr:VCBS repeat-containing protein [Acidobacteriota bacterium]
MNVRLIHARRFLLLLCFSSFLAAPAVKAQTVEATTTTITVQANLSPAFIGAGNINGDAAPDIYVTDASAKYSILLNDGTGSFLPALTANTSAVATIYSDTKDVNNDGKLDLVFIQGGAAPFGPHSIYVRLGDGTGGFAAPVTTQFGSGNVGLVDVAAADFNLDNKLDFAISTSGPGQSVPGGGVYLLYGNGAGGFPSSVLLNINSRGADIAAGDFNNDGKLDLVGVQGTNVSTLLGTGAGDFVAGGSIAVTAAPFGTVVADFNRDGKPDAALIGGGAVFIVYGNGSGGFTHFGILGAGSTPVDLAVADFNRNSTPDLAVANFGSNNVTVILEPSGTTLPLKTQFDFDGDLRADIAVYRGGNTPGAPSFWHILRSSDNTYQG